jgi:hypothetical protein
MKNEMKLPKPVVLTRRLAAKADSASRTRCREETSYALQHIDLADP